MNHIGNKSNLRTKINEGWKFALLDVDTPDGYEAVVDALRPSSGMKTSSGIKSSQEEAAQVSGVPAWSSSMSEVTLPHDWLIYDTTDLYRDGLGVYVKTIDIGGDVSGRYFVIFDGVYMDSVYYVNGKRAGEWKYGYSQFVLDITDYVHTGENELLVTVRHRSPNTRWYSGAGIYRDVWFMHTAEVYIPVNGVYVHTSADHTLEVDIEVCMPAKLYTSLTDISGPDLSAGGRPAADSSDDRITCMIAIELDRANHSDFEYLGMTPGKTEVPGTECMILSYKCKVHDPHLWDIDDPYLYDLKVTFDPGLPSGNVPQTDTVRFGFKEVRMDPDHGFFLNGRNLKLNGVCEHHDLGLFGAEFNQPAMRRKVEILKKMGVNAIRGTHNMMAPGMLDLCDEMGLLFISEAFDMWEHPKTDYDYARFFDEWHERDVRSWVRRDRNHTCVIIWSIGNEISDIHTEEVRGPELTRELMELVKSHDYKNNARVSQGSNYMPWENAQKCTDILKIAGYNYGESCYAEHHKAHPDWVIYGSETSSIVQSRGVYHFPLSANVIGEDDMQCSALGNSPTSWSAKSYETCACIDRDAEFSMGQFLWSGFDYIGEPTPFQTRNSYFGQIDTAGFPKDSYYFWKSMWTDCRKDPFVHVFPYWDFNEGQLVDVRVVSNLDEVELFVNNESLGRQTLDHAPGSGMHVIADYSVKYTPGVIEARAYEKGSTVAAVTCMRTSFKDTDRLVVRKYEFDEGFESDIAFFEISAVDADGNQVMNACDIVHVRAIGGTLIGLDNGDSYDPDGYRTDKKRLFNGYLLAAVRTDGNASDVAIDAHIITDEIPDVRRISLICEGDPVLTPDNMRIKVRAQIHPESASKRQISFKVTDDFGVDSRLADIETNGNEVYITAKGDGRFRLRATAGNEKQPVRVISELGFEVRDVGCAYFDPYTFISGSSYSSFVGDVTNGNEKGAATGRDSKTILTYTDIDFGRAGTSRIIVPIFSLDSDDVPFKLWEGIPGEPDAELLLEADYHQKRIWNTYIEQTFDLNKKITGKQTVSFEFDQKIHLKGFSFIPASIAGTVINAADADAIYGDSFTRCENAVEKIGNNVSLEYKAVNFGDGGISKVRIKGRTPNEKNPVHIRFFRDDQSIKEVCEFERSAEYVEREFPLPKVTGTWDVSIVFMPGSEFDLASFCFE